ncbi:hypothetical protein WJX72_002592 [[Myrmecia] bisecta]|uniref:VHS domain-containing protein n=1 Tax=[Myrmecia] bisecta TaxID=41462 RepID=A0AAW1P7Z0_9CHLO
MFASLQNKRKLEEATSPKDDVTPVYLLEEVWQLLQNGPPDVTAGMIDFTNRRLGHKSPIVKQKTLRVIKYICSKGSSDYKRNISKHATAVRELTHYKGEQDPFKGDVPNQRVRDSAKEALDAMFGATETGYNPNSATPTLTNRIQGFGSASADSGMALSSTSTANGDTATSSSGGGRMQGFGNPRFESSAKAGGGLGGAGQKWMPSIPKGLIAAKRAPMLNTEDKGGYSSGEDNGTYRRPTPLPAQQPPPSRLSAPADGSEEQRLVDQICTPGGLRAQPEREDLRVFVESTANHNGPTLARLLQNKLESGSWQETLRGLCALEAVINQGSSASCGEIAVHFQADPSAVRKATTSPQATVRQRAAKVLQLIGGSTLDDTSSSAAPVANGGKAGQPDLIGDLLGGSDSEPAPRASGDLLSDLMGDPTPTSSADLGMFSGLAVSSAAQPSAAQHSAAPSSNGLAELSGLSVPATSASQPSAADMFGGLSLGGGAGAQQASTASSAFAAGPAQSAGDLLGGLSSGGDLFGGMAVSGSTQQAAGDMFGGLSLSGSTAPTAPTAAAASSNGLPDIFSGVSTSTAPGRPAALGLDLSSAPSMPSTAAQPTPASAGRGPMQPLGLEFTSSGSLPSPQGMMAGPGLGLQPLGSQGFGGGPGMYGNGMASQGSGVMPQMPQMGFMGGMPGMMPGMQPGMPAGMFMQQQMPNVANLSPMQIQQLQQMAMQRMMAGGMMMAPQMSQFQTPGFGFPGMGLPQQQPGGLGSHPSLDAHQPGTITTNDTDLMGRELPKKDTTFGWISDVTSKETKK